MTRSLQLRFTLPPEIAMVAAVYRVKSDLTVEFAVYRKRFNAGESNTSLVSEGEFGELKIRNFFPGSGCGFIIKDGKIDWTEPGLRNFVGKSVLIIGDSNDALLVTWEKEPAELSPEFRRDLETVMRGFPMTLR